MINIICLIGKTASGKDTLKNELLKLGYKGIVTYTSRQPRPGEVDGITYNFISAEQFLWMKEKGFFAETTSYNVASGETWYYGTAKEDLDDNAVIIVNPDGLKALKGEESLNIMSFYLKVCDAVIVNRLGKRGDDTYESVRRIIADHYDFEGIEEQVDFVLKNDLGIEPSNMAWIIDWIYRKKGE